MSKFENNRESYDTENERGYERIFVAPEVSSPCLVCREPTHWVNCATGMPFCSHECVDDYWESYFKRVREEVEMVKEMQRQGIDPEAALDQKLKEMEEELELEEFVKEGGGIIN